MANILTTGEAANVLRTTETDETMLDLLPLVDKYIEMATGRDWTADATVRSVRNGSSSLGQYVGQSPESLT